MRAFSLAARWVLPWGLALLAACTDRYMPSVVTTPPGYLVVDGFLNSQGATSIKLSRTYAVASAAAPPVETKATVYVEDDAGGRTLLRESPAGTYASGAQTLNPARKYRLHINTLSGKEYASDYVPVKTTPAIDNVGWQPDNTGLHIGVSTHDATNGTQYYRWEYVETWEILPPYNPSVEFVNGQMRDIVVHYPTMCWGNAASTSVLISKTTALTQDVVANFQLRTLPLNSERLYTRYSILVQQHALTQDEYAYWELLRKNTESIGTLFDPQPAQLTGNVHCLSNAADLALGFVGAHSVTEKRIFVLHSDLPRGWPVVSGYEGCIPPDTVFIDRPSPPPPNPAVLLQAAFNPASGLLPIFPIFQPGSGRLIGYTAKPRDCVDCRTRGSSVKPSYWP